MQYIFLVYHSESNYEFPTFVRAFSSEYAAITFIENHPDNEKRFLDWEKVAAEIDLRDY